MVRPVERKKSLPSRVWGARQAYLFLLPLLAGLLIFNYYPFFSGLYHSLFDWDAVGTVTFIGLDNFKELFSDPDFLSTIPTLFKIAIPKILISIFVPLIAAEMIFAVRSDKAQRAYRVIVLLPMVAPGVVMMLLWKYIYDPNAGVLTAVLRTLGILGEEQVINWLGDPNWVIFSIVFMYFPWIGGTSVLIYMSGLINISTEIIESTRLDGANTFQRIWHVDIPLLMGQIRYFLIFGIIGNLQDYNVQLVLTGGGPGYTTMVPGYYMYRKAFLANRMGYASAVGVVLFAVIMLLTFLFYRYLNSDATNDKLS